MSNNYGDWEMYMNNLTQEQEQEQEEQQQHGGGEMTAQQQAFLAQQQAFAAQQSAAYNQYYGGGGAMTAQQQAFAAQQQAQQQAQQSAAYNQYYGGGGAMTAQQQAFAAQQQAQQSAAYRGGGAMTAQQQAMYSQPKRVYEVEPRDVGAYLEDLKSNSRIPFTPEHNEIYDLIKEETLDLSTINVEKFLAATNERNEVVGMGVVTIRDRAHQPIANLDTLLSVEKGAGKAIVDAAIDYSRQMENRAGVTTTVLTPGLKGFYAKFGFAENPEESPRAMVREKSAEFNPHKDITKFRPLPSTNQEIQNKRNRAMRR